MSQRQFGLIGKNIDYSFSKKYFTKKFALENLTDCFYENFESKSDCFGLCLVFNSAKTTRQC